MITQVQVRRFLPLLMTVGLAWLSGAGCSSLSYHAVDYVGVPHPPRTDTAQVEILRAEPERKHVRLGEVVAEVSIDPPPPIAKIEAGLRREAAKMGADAVWVVTDRTQVTGAQWTGPYWAPSVNSLQSRIIVAVAIRYE